MTVCKCVHYSGRVQGVGFRYTTQEIARQHPVVGYVKNLPDGRVELVAEGEPVAVSAFLAAVSRQLGRYITHQEESDESPQGFADFAIRA